MLPRWVRPENELTNQPYSSVVFAVDSFDQHAHFLRTAKTMAAFGRLATTREWTDRPPITQCHRCWRLDHRTTTCQQPPRCRICGEEHEESHHYNPLAPTTDDAEMQVDQDARANQLTNPLHKLQTCGPRGHGPSSKLDTLSGTSPTYRQPTRQDKVKVQT